MSSINSIRISQEIEEAILSGRFKPRERLIEMDLISRFGVSRTVIREALKRLEAKGLVRATPYRGVVVADLTVEEIEEIYFVRIELEKIAARLILNRITPKEIRNLKELRKKVQKHFRERTPQMIEADSQFHQAIIRACGNGHLCDIIEYLYKKAHIVVFNAWSLPRRIEESIIEHREIIKAIEERDLVRLQKVMLKHLTTSRDSYISQLKRLSQKSPAWREL